MTENDWRNGFHISPRRGRLNDPAGLCQFKGTYHVFYQLNRAWPDAKLPKSWGHATSRDLVSWTDEGEAIRADSAYDASGAFTGSAVVRDGRLWVYYTGNVEEPGLHDAITDGRESNVVLVTSEDGTTFSNKTCVLRNSDYPDECSRIVRDPKVWEDEGRLRMLLGARDLDGHGLALLYESADGLSWQLASTIRSDEPFGYMWEAPDRIRLGGRSFLSFCPQGLSHDRLRFANNFESGYVWLGDTLARTCAFDESTFNEWDHGFDFYTPQTFVDERGRTILMAWLGVPGAGYGSVPATPGSGWSGDWNGCLSVPRELSLNTTESGNDYIRQWPVAELESLRGEPVRLRDDSPTTSADDTLLPTHRADIVIEGIRSRAASITLDEDVSFSFGNYRADLRFAEDAASSAGRTKRACALSDNTLHSLRILVDSSAIEIFANGGEKVFSTRWFPRGERLSVSTNIEAESMVAYPMGSGTEGLW
ncbi:glycoside hydrolase family 32 protein [Olsenella sp. YH-ols2223]|uniref:beta-fructofuranosidase n=1 Tax=Olsenella absiana TaxID=3115222 RepID=A0ABU7R8P4_9ACTN